MSTVRPTSNQSMTSEYQDMSSVQAFGRSLVRREQFRAGGCIETAISNVAARLKTGRSTLANIIRNRVKGVCFMLGQRIIAAGLSDIENERRQLDHERELLLAVATTANADDLAAVEAALEAARAGLAKMRARP